MLSVITITFNNFAELQSTLQSLENQPVQRVIVNGGSCPETGKLLSTKSGAADWISLSEKDRGISDAFNKGLALATGNAVAYLNSGDTLIDPSYYAEAMAILENNPDIDFVYADLLFKDIYAGEITVKSGNSLPAMPFLHPTLIVRREVFDKIGNFNLDFRIAMDLDFAYRLVRSGARGHYIPRMVVAMDGAGVSSTRFFRTYREVASIIIRNRDFSLNSLMFFTVGFIRMCGKYAILFLGLSRLLTWYRKKKYRTF